MSDILADRVQTLESALQTWAEAYRRRWPDGKRPPPSVTCWPPGPDDIGLAEAEQAMLALAGKAGQG